MPSAAAMSANTRGSSETALRSSPRSTCACRRATPFELRWIAARSASVPRRSVAVSA